MFGMNKNGRLSRDSHSHINLISIMKNNFYSVRARQHGCSLRKRYTSGIKNLLQWAKLLKIKGICKNSSWFYSMNAVKIIRICLI